MSTRNKALAFSAWILICASIGALGYCAWVYVDAAIFQQRETKQLSKPARITPQTPENTPRPDGNRLIPHGAAFAKLTVPRLGISVVVAEGDDNRTLRRAAGHIPGTAFPGKTGNTSIAAHRDTFFHNLRNVRTGDVIIVQTSDGEYRYKVSWFRVVQPDNVGVLNPTPNPSLTLITCYPFNFIGAAPKRFIVRAQLIDSGARGVTT